MAHNINRCSVCRHSVWRGAVPHLQVESQWQQNFFRINFWFANERQVHGEGECWPRLLGSIIHSWSVEPSRNFHNIQGPSSCWKCLLVLLSHHTASDLRNYAKLEIGISSWLILWKLREVSLLALIVGRCCRLVPRGRACCRARAATSRWTRCGAPPWQAAPSPCSTPSHTPAAIGENRERYYLIFRESASIIKC